MDSALIGETLCWPVALPALHVSGDDCPAYEGCEAGAVALLGFHVRRGAIGAGFVAGGLFFAFHPQDSTVGLGFGLIRFGGRLALLRLFFGLRLRSAGGKQQGGRYVGQGFWKAYGKLHQHFFVFGWGFKGK
jgi:hypothetical protein